MIEVSPFSKALYSEFKADFNRLSTQILDDYWQDESYLSDLPLKFETSYALFSKRSLIAFLICSVKMQANALHIHRLVVSDQHQKLGIGQAMIRLSISNARMAGLAKVTLKVHKTNERAIGFYKNIDFKERAISGDYILYQLEV